MNQVCYLPSIFKQFKLKKAELDYNRKAGEKMDHCFNFLIILNHE